MEPLSVALSLLPSHLLPCKTMIPDAGRILGVDWGEVRIGLALSDESQTLATPLEALVRRAGKRLPLARLLDLISIIRSASLSVFRSLRKGPKRRARVPPAPWPILSPATPACRSSCGTSA